MNTTERICYLKGGELFSVKNGSLHPILPEEITSGGEKTAFVIDDGYFFYVGMDSVSVTGKKLRSVAGNYLSVIFPGDMVNDFGVYQGKGFTVIFVLSDELSHIIKEYPELFSSAKKITTPFIELASRYEDFIFSDGKRLYKKSGTEISAAEPEEKGVTASDLFSETETLKTSVQLPGVNRTVFSKTPYILPAAILAACYTIFLISGIVSLNSISKIEDYYREKLDNVYKAAGVDGSGDPYGMLLYKSNQAGKSFDGKRIISIIADLKDIAGNDAELSTFSVRDKAVRADGITDDFATAEKLKKTAEEKLRTSVSVDDTKKTDKGVTFVMRYEQ